MKNKIQICAMGLVAVLVIGASVLVKGSPIGWKATTPDGVMICDCASCTFEDCSGRRSEGSPFLESYVSGNRQLNNIFAPTLNSIIKNAGIPILFGAGVVAVGAIAMKKARKRSNE